MVEQLNIDSQREAARKSFVRQALVTSAIITIEQAMERADIHEMEFQTVHQNVQQMTGLTLEPDYVLHALQIWSQTGWAVESEQFGDSQTVH